MKIKFVSFAYKRLRNFFSYKRWYTAWIRPSFAQLDSHLDPKVEIKNPQRISIGKNVTICAYTWVCAMINDLPRIGVFNPSIQIGDNTVIGRFGHITISNQLIIEPSVLITEGVLITDSIHGFEDVHTPVIAQPLLSLGPIIIGEGSWIGNRACIVGKVKIGKHVVVGANTYIDKDIPDYCVVVGSPARIVRRYDTEQQAWLRVNESLSGLKTK